MRLQKNVITEKKWGGGSTMEHPPPQSVFFLPLNFNLWLSPPKNCHLRGQLNFNFKEQGESPFQSCGGDH